MKVGTATQSGISSSLTMIRPANSLMVGFAVVVGVAATSNSYREIFSLVSLLGFLTGFLISSFSMVSNDIYDLEVDRVNQPGRPLPSGIVSVRNAWVLATLLLIAGLLAAAALGMANFLIASLFALIGWYYNYRGKKMGLLGNSLVALSLAIPYIYGSVALQNYSVNLGYLLALTSFLAGLGREVLKGISDVEGDKIRNVRTVAISRGVKTARLTTAVLFMLAVVSSALPIVFQLLGRALPVYLVLVAIPDAIFSYLTYKVLTLKNDKDSLRLKSLALIGMMLGLIAYLISGLTV
ncbi:MAG: geranylgeranylglycerol-phosphate geranylgeranyltransferase [Nitrososphaerota archaeon]|nr:geranylgeranylglycerol-phosphate geranylgeranyltransferase [Nitrososphaerota archaeon]